VVLDFGLRRALGLGRFWGWGLFRYTIVSNPIGKNIKKDAEKIYAIEISFMLMKHAVF
jgi:hypothetical protein